MQEIHSKMNKNIELINCIFENHFYFHIHAIPPDLAVGRNVFLQSGKKSSASDTDAPVSAGWKALTKRPYSRMVSVNTSP